MQSPPYDTDLVYLDEPGKPNGDHPLRAKIRPEWQDYLEAQANTANQTNTDGVILYAD